MIRGLWNKKTFQRIFLNDIVENLDIKNETILDIGGGNKNSSYHAILALKGNRFISVDMTSNCDYRINLEEEELPFDNDSQNIIFCFNVMEHLFNYQNLVDEIYRVLKKDGKLYFYVPFLINKHTNPHDYFRYTDDALSILFSKIGFNSIDMDICYGSGKMVHSTLSWLLSNHYLLKVGNVLNVLSGIFFASIDFLLNLFDRTRKINKNFILGIYMECKK